MRSRATLNIKPVIMYVRDVVNAEHGQHVAGGLHLQRRPLCCLCMHSGHVPRGPSMLLMLVVSCVAYPLLEIYHAIVV